MKIVRLVLMRLALVGLIAACFSVCVAVIFAVVCLAAIFSFGHDTPPFPWELLRFFLCIGWLMAIPLGLTAPLDEAHP